MEARKTTGSARAPQGSWINKVSAIAASLLLLPAAYIFYGLDCWMGASRNIWFEAYGGRSTTIPMASAGKGWLRSTGRGQQTTQVAANRIAVARSICVCVA